MENIEKSNQGEMSAGEEKVREYVRRINSGEPKETVLEGLPLSFRDSIESGLKESEFKESYYSDNIIPPQYKGLDADTLDFIWTIPEYIDKGKTVSEKKRKQEVLDFLRSETLNVDGRSTESVLSDDIKRDEVREKLGLSVSNDLESKKQELENILTEKESRDYEDVKSLVKYITHGRKQVVLDLYENLLKNIQDPESRKNLISGLFQDVYNKYRIADYQHNLQEEEIWTEALESKNVPINTKSPEWQYRGIFPNETEKTVTRGSLNVEVNLDLIDKLDTMITEGKIRGNYKFGQPGTSASPSERHDSITIYFLEIPSEEVIEEISNTIKPYVRGDGLLGKKVADGFFMSEIGSIESDEINIFIDKLKLVDEVFAEAVKNYTSPQIGRGNSLKMSEAQFYAIKDVARAFGYNVAYNQNTGFDITASTPPPPPSLPPLP